MHCTCHGYEPSAISVPLVVESGNAYLTTRALVQNLFLHDFHVKISDFCKFFLSCSVFVPNRDSQIHVLPLPPTDLLVCGKTCLVGLLIRSIFRGKNCTSASARVQFFQRKSNELTDQQDMFCYNHASAFYTSNNIVKMLMNNKFKAQTVTGNPTGNYRWQLFNVTCI